MFWDCPYPQKLWNAIWQYISLIANKKFEIDIDNVILLNMIKKNKSSLLFPLL